MPPVYSADSEEAPRGFVHRDFVDMDGVEKEQVASPLEPVVATLSITEEYFKPDGFTPENGGNQRMQNRFSGSFHEPQGHEMAQSTIWTSGSLPPVPPKST